MFFYRRWTNTRFFEKPKQSWLYDKTCYFLDWKIFKECSATAATEQFNTPKIKYRAIDYLYGCVSVIRKCIDRINM
jgi:hypothetical protein